MILHGFKVKWSVKIIKSTYSMICIKCLIIIISIQVELFLFFFFSFFFFLTTKGKNFRVQCSEFTVSCVSVAVDWTHQQRPLISVVPSCGGSGTAGCCWSAAPVSGAPGWAARRAAARQGSTFGTGSEQRSPLWQTLLTEATGSCCWSSERCKPPAGAANTRRSHCPRGQQTQGHRFTCVLSYMLQRDGLMGNSLW